MNKWVAKISPTADQGWTCARAVEAYLEGRPDVEDVEYKAENGYKNVFFSCCADEPIALHLMIEKCLEENGIVSAPLVVVERVDVMADNTQENIDSTLKH